MRRPIRFTIYVGLAWAWMLSAGRTDEVNWYSNLDSAIQAAREQNRPLLLHFWSPDCPQCLQADEAVFSRSSVAETLADFYVPVKINAREQPETAHQHRVQSLPQDVILSPEGRELHRLITPSSPQQYIAQLSAMAFRSGMSPTTTEQTSAWGGPSPTLPPLDQMNRPRSEVAQAAPPAYGGLPASEGSRSSTAAAVQPQEVINQYARHSAEPEASAAIPADVERAEPNGPGPAKNPPARSRWGAWPTRSTEPAPSREDLAASTAPSQERDSAPPPPQRRESSAPTSPDSANRPPLGMDGYCPVTLLKKDVWKQGDPRHGVVHRGRLYLFAGPDEAEAFFRNPDDFSPVLAGIDPVHLADSGEPVEGRRAHGVVYRKRVYLFSSEQNLQRFWQDPEKYVSPIRQAMETNTVNRLFR